MPRTQARHAVGGPAREADHPKGFLIASLGLKVSTFGDLFAFEGK